jgi:hypothetical protein
MWKCLKSLKNGSISPQNSSRMLQKDSLVLSYVPIFLKKKKKGNLDLFSPFSFLVVLRFELGLTFAQLLYHSSHDPSPKCFSYFFK